MSSSLPLSAPAPDPEAGPKDPLAASGRLPAPAPRPLLLRSGIELAAAIRRREVSSREVVDEHIRWIERVNPAINAVVATRFDEARREAAEADRLVARQPPELLPPFLGVPCTIKESFALQGMPNTAGLAARRGVPAGADATTVARLRAAGAIPVGVTNTSELCMWYETSNRVYGRTRNPYDTRRIVGGSSGGEGAIVGAGGVPFGLGGDIGGSIRMPAFFNGVFGHKPTGGLVPGTGQFPAPASEAMVYLTSGPLARRAEDLMPFLLAIAGPDGIDPACRPFALGDQAKVELSGMRVLDVEDDGVHAVAGELADAQRRCARWLASRGAAVERVRIDGLACARDIWGSMLSAAGGPSFSEMLGNGRPIARARELARWAIGRSAHTLPAILLTLLEDLPHLMAGRTRRSVERGCALRDELAARIGPHGVMLYPSFTRPAPRHHWPLVHPFHFVYTAILNVLELPATQVPLGLSSEGIPLGVQVVGTHGADHLTIRVACELEGAFGGWVPPSGGGHW
jgi:fatty acid amide hydrolase 2